VLVGPTAEEQVDRQRATVTTEALKDLLRRAAEIVPALADIPVTATYAGLRPATEHKSYRIIARPQQRAITLGGIRSTGLSSALGLAQHALRLAESFGTQWPAPPPAPPTIMPNLAEHAPRDWQRPDHGAIICHCELVTQREIAAALASPIPPGDFGGLRRRTRAGMGRCQGFYCHARLAQITAGQFAEPLAVTSDSRA
jgi:glycerol-3-phosphate dehydrogenase